MRTIPTKARNGPKYLIVILTLFIFVKIEINDRLFLSNLKFSIIVTQPYTHTHTHLHTHAPTLNIHPYTHTNTHTHTPHTP